MTWILLDPKHLRNTAGNGILAKRVYGQDGKAWPRLVLSIFRGRQGDGPGPTIDAIKVACTKKQSGGSWWEDCDVPLELVDDLILLLSEVRVKLGGTHA